VLLAVSCGLLFSGGFLRAGGSNDLVFLAVVEEETGEEAAAFGAGALAFLEGSDDVGFAAAVGN
jgi:hypothetical protein